MPRPRWEYRRLVVWPKNQATVEKDNRGPYLEYSERGDLGSYLFQSKLDAERGTATRLPLNPGREWENVPYHELVTWDDEAEWADLAMEVISRLGQEGWELAGMHIRSESEGFYFFKRPQA